MTDAELLQIIEEAAREGATKLDLSGNQLSQLPPEIAQLTNLQSLYLSHNRLNQLPSEISQLSRLTTLDLSYNQLNQLPSEIGQLSYLKKLDLTDNQLSQLPPEIGQLSHLTNLYLTNNQLNQVPPKICQLAKLKKLSFRDNQLSELPPEIGQLKELKVLDISRNKLSKIAKEITELKQLEKLYLWINELKGFPLEITGLLSLKKLSIAQNKLESLPTEIGNLESLEELYLDGNELRRLPSEIEKITSLKTLDLQGNKLDIDIPPEVLSKTNEPASIINYYLKHTKGSKNQRPLNEVKLLIVGQGSVGKTSLVKKLRDQDYNLHEHKTEGINISKWTRLIDGQNIQVNIWDFGGQEIMHATHQFFLTKRSLYLLVLDSRLGEEDNRLEYWLKIIDSFSDKSPIIIIGNKKDQHHLDIDRTGLQKKYPTIKDFVETSCEKGEGIDQLKQAIDREINNLSHIHDQLLISWFTVKEKLQELDIDYIPYSAYQEICQKENITDEISQKTLLGFLHDLGVVLNFHDDPRLADNNVLNPEWVTNGVYKILNNRELIIDNKGVLNLKSDQLSHILDPQKYPIDKHFFIIDMMKKFELCFSIEEDKEYLIPDILPKEEPDTGDWENALAFQYHYQVLPSSIISRFIVRMNHLISKYTYWRSGVVLASQEGNRALIKADREDKKIFILVSGNEKTRRNFLNIIRDDFQAIHKTIPALQAVEKVPIPNHNDIIVDYKHLLTLERNNVLELIPEGLDKPVSVKELLNGIESEEKRRRQQQYPGNLPTPPLNINQQTSTNSNHTSTTSPPKNNWQESAKTIAAIIASLGGLAALLTVIFNQFNSQPPKNQLTPSPSLSPSPTQFSPSPNTNLSK